MRQSLVWALIWFLLLLPVMSFHYKAVTAWDKVLVVFFMILDAISFLWWGLQSSMEHPARKERQSAVPPTYEAMLNDGKESKVINVPSQVYASTVPLVELPDHKVAFWAESVIRMEKHGKVNLTEKKWGGDGKLFSQPAYRWMKHYLTEQGALKKGAWRTAPHEIVNLTYLQDLKAGRKKIPPPPANWH